VAAQTARQQAATLFQYPMCARALRNARLYNTSCATNLVLDATKTCCTADHTDCAGVCYGKSQLALWAPNGYPKNRPTHKTWICCPSDSAVDCAGYCVAPGQKGLARDACGKCGGTDKKGLGCSTGVKVKTGWGYNELYYFIDYATPTQVRVFSPANALNVRVVHGPLPSLLLQLWAVTPLNISNTNTTGIMVNFSLAGSIYASPDVSLNIPVATNIYVAPLSNLVVPVNFSMRRVFTGLAQTWMVKTLIISYWRPAISGSLSFNYVVDTYPQGLNCSTIASASACVRVPACILCPTEPQIRVLTEVEVGGELQGEALGYVASADEQADAPDEADEAPRTTSQEVQPYVHDRRSGVEPPPYDGHVWWDVDDEDAEGETEAQRMRPRGRVLYTGLVPGQLSDVDDPGYLRGACVNGFINNDCPFPSAATRAAASAGTVAAMALALTLTAVALLINIHE
jgi:hypothetical protein